MQGPFVSEERLEVFPAVVLAGAVTAALWLPARVAVEGLEHVPTGGPAILAANHLDNWDGYLLLHLVPRTVHVVAVPETLIRIHPEWRAHKFFVVRDEIIIVDENFRIIAVLAV